LRDTLSLVTDSEEAERMSAINWPHRYLTFEDWAALPEFPGHQVEVVEGVLVASPRPVSFHLLAVTRLAYLINEQLPDSLMALAEAELLISERPVTVRSPDVLVTSTELVETNPARYQADELRLVVEVLSEGSRRTDRVTKFSEYAEAGIERYWIVDLDPPVSLITYGLIEEDYEDFGEQTGLAELEIAGTAVTIDLNALTTRRAQRP